MKLLLKLLLLFGTTAYIIFAMLELNKPDTEAVCGGTDVVVTDSTLVGFIRAEEVESLLKKAELDPTGKKMQAINTKAIEDELQANPFIDSVVCYKTPAGFVKIILTQLHPVMRIMADNGDDYYVTAEGDILPKMNYTTYLPVATGVISRKYAAKELSELGAFFRDNDFWNDQIEQVCVGNDGMVELIMRVGSQVVYVGEPRGLDKKMDNLKVFYQKVMSHVGWNKYSRINVEYDNQIICTKRTET